MSPGEELKEIDLEIAALKERIRALERRGVELMTVEVIREAREAGEKEPPGIMKIVLTGLVMLLLVGLIWLVLIKWR